MRGRHAEGEPVSVGVASVEGAAPTTLMDSFSPATCNVTITGAADPLAVTVCVQAPKPGATTRSV